MLEAAVDWLRKKGLAAAAKKSGRVAAEGLVGVASAPRVAAMVEVNAETDFVARNEQFQAFVEAVAKLALTVGDDIEALKAAPYPDSAVTVAEELTQLVATIGENMTLRRAKRLSVTDGVVATYVHSALRPGLGKIGVLVAVQGPRRAGGAGDARPPGRHARRRQRGRWRWTSTRVDPAALEREKAMLIEQAKQSGRPDNDHREDGRGPHPQVLRGSRAAGAGLGARRRKPGEGGAEEGRRDAARLRALPAWARASTSRRARTSPREVAATAGV